MVPKALWYGRNPAPPPAKLVAVVALVALVALPTVMLAGLVQAGAEAPAVKMYVDDPSPRNVVAPEPVWYGTLPAAPPARFVAVVAVVALPADPAVAA